MANALTIGRMIAVIIFLGAFTANAPWNMTAALVIFILAAATDALDGWVARARNETSALGAALDPIADKLLIAAALFLLTRNGVIRGPEVLAALAIILREVLVSGLREAAAAQGARLAVTGLAKSKTVAQSLAIAALLATAPTGPLGQSNAGVASFILWVAAGLTVWTGFGYVRQAVKVLSPTAADAPPTDET